ncbi:MAG: exodeoxyribonuclease V subunit gamma, partial [Chlamydiota bacterium]
MVLVPNDLFKQWLPLALTRRKGIVMGLQFFTVDEAFSVLNESRALCPNSLEMRCLIYQALLESSDPGLLKFLSEKKKRLLDLTDQLASLFFTYGQFGKSLFEPQKKSANWQHAILQKIFVEGFWRLPAQTTLTPKHNFQSVHCFGIDFLPPLFWEELFRISPLSLYLFSPCSEFWGDFCTDRERRNLNRLGRKRGTSQNSRELLNRYLREHSPLLANLGKLGRETLKALDRFDLQIEEAYPHSVSEESSLLKKLQSAFLTLEPLTSGVCLEKDNSIQIVLTGASKLREIEILRESILTQVNQHGLSFDEITVAAPDITLYAPLIEFVFSDPENFIPYRILGFDQGSKSSFSQGFLRLLNLAAGRWGVEDMLALFETPAFYKSQGWSEDLLEKFREWVKAAQIDWGLDQKTREKRLEEIQGETILSSNMGSWEGGLDLLLNRMIFVSPEDPLNQWDIRENDLEDLIEVISVLKAQLASLQREKSLSTWADDLEKLVEKFLLSDFSSDADVAAENAFKESLRGFRKAAARIHGNLPFSFIQRLLSKSISTDLHASHLHSLCMHSMDRSFTPTKALFLIGMDEESFPKQNSACSLDLLKKEKISPPEPADRDRYLFLQALFAPSEVLSVSYGHLSADEGKPVGPSIVIQELLSYLGAYFSLKAETLTVIPPSLSFDARCFSDLEKPHYSKADFRAAKAFYSPKEKDSLWKTLSSLPELKLPSEENALSFVNFSLLARHPWKFYLQKIQGIYLNEPAKEDWEESFALQKSRHLRTFFDQPLDQEISFSRNALPDGLFGEAYVQELKEKTDEWRSHISSWGVKEIFSVIFQESCQTKRWEGGNLIVPPLEIALENRSFRLIGEIKNVSPEGLICSADDNVGGVLKVWPEALAVGAVLSQPNILMLKTGKIKKFEHSDSGAYLSRFLEYYFRCHQGPSPLLIDWADAILRKGPLELEKKMKTTLSGRDPFTDPVINWVLARSEIPSAQELLEGWGEYLKGTFAGLAELYPTRARSGKGEESHAAL